MPKTLFLTSISLWLCLFTPHAWSQSVAGERGQLTLSKEKEVHVSDSHFPMTGFSDVDFFPDGSFVATSSQDGLVVQFSKTGEQIGVVGGKGRGPFEYDYPGSVRTVGDEIWVYDQNALKMIRYGRDGRHIGELAGINTAIRDFQVLPGGDLLAFYTPSGFTDFVRLYDIQNQSILSRHGDEGVMHAVLMMLGSVGRIAISNDHVFYGSPIRPEVMSVRIDGTKGDRLLLDDREFAVDDPGWDSIADVNAHMSDVPEFLFTNSAFSGLLKTSDWIVAVTENGKHPAYNLAEQFNIEYTISESDRRRMKIDVLTPDLKLVDTFLLDPAFHDEYGVQLLAAHENQLVFFSEGASHGGAELRRTLTFFKIK